MTAALPLGGRLWFNVADDGRVKELLLQMAAAVQRDAESQAGVSVQQDLCGLHVTHVGAVTRQCHAAHCAHGRQRTCANNNSALSQGCSFVFFFVLA